MRDIQIWNHLQKRIFKLYKSYEYLFIYLCNFIEAISIQYIEEQHHSLIGEILFGQVKQAK